MGRGGQSRMRRWGGEDGAWHTVSCDDIPPQRSERYGSQGEEEGRFGSIEEGSERHNCYVVVVEASKEGVC